MKRLFFILFAACVAEFVSAQVSLDRPNFQESTMIAPYYFGPNAFPVPDMLDGRVSDKLDIRLAGDYYAGDFGDITGDVFLSVKIPLFTRRVNLSLWMPVIEYYRNTPESMEHRRIDGEDCVSGYEAGDAYVSTDIQLFYERKFTPDVALRAALKTASGGGFHKARYYDNPGYFFDLAVGKSFALPERCYVENFRLSGAAGFLCWQTDNGRQNDAVMYGLQLSMQARHFSVSADWRGYWGWERNGDSPMVLAARCEGRLKNFTPFVQYQWGIQDYPFHLVRIGLGYRIDILRTEK